MISIITVGVAGLILLSFTSMWCIEAWLKLGAFILVVLKWAFIIGSTVSFLCAPIIYKEFGITPISILVDAINYIHPTSGRSGHDLYNGSNKRHGDNNGQRRDATTEI